MVKTGQNWSKLYIAWSVIADDMFDITKQNQESLTIPTPLLGLYNNGYWGTGIEHYQPSAIIA